MFGYVLKHRSFPIGEGEGGWGLMKRITERIPPKAGSDTMEDNTCLPAGRVVMKPETK